MTNVKGQFIRIHKVSGKFSGCSMIISLGPKRLKTQFFENKAISLMKKKLWPVSSGIIEHDKNQGTNYKCPKGIFTSFEQAV